VEAWGRVKHHLAELGRDEAAYGRELLTIFAKDPQVAADEIRMFRDVGGTHGTVHSMNKGLPRDIDAHIEYVAKAKQLIDAG